MAAAPTSGRRREHLDRAELRAALAGARARTLALVAPLGDTDLERVHSPIMSPLVWDLGHIAAYEDLWLAHRLGGQPLLRPDLAATYDAFETPRSHRGAITLLRRDACLEYMERVRERTLDLLERDDLDDGDDATIWELVLRHEHQHNETMLQTLELARLDSYAPAAATVGPTAPVDAAYRPGDDLECIEVPAGRFELGASTEGFAYDNERPRQSIELGRFAIGRYPVTNGSFRDWARDGGYRRREHWSEAGWAWRCEHQVERPLNWIGEECEWRISGWEPLDPRKPVIHISWFEADAFARAHHARLPTEVEWERAATWSASGRSERWPWGSHAPDRDHATLAGESWGPQAVDAHPAGASALGCMALIGDVWEWTASEFDGYPGFRAHPYREYSEVFFRSGYRVLRGGSWATTARVATTTFRNWDLPQRRQIFAGLRIARDGAG